MPNTREKLEVIAHLGDHITYKEDIGICYDSALAKVIEDAYMTLKNGVTVQEWISVKDRLPEKMGEYVCRYVFGENEEYPFEQVLWYYTALEKPHFQHEGSMGLRVTHWMPLPQPPKGE